MLCLFLSSGAVFANTGKKTHLAVGLFFGAHSSTLTYAFVSTRNGQIIGAQVVREEMFMYSALGHWPSFVNPARENLFEKYGIDSCFLIKDEYGKVVNYYCKPFKELWKVRYKEHPMQYDLNGWGKGQYKPSVKQLEYLKAEYGIHNLLTEYIYGDSLFKLLRNVQDKTWVSAYSAMPADPPFPDP